MLLNNLLIEQKEIIFTLNALNDQLMQENNFLSLALEKKQNNSLFFLMNPFFLFCGGVVSIIAFRALYFNFFNNNSFSFVENGNSLAFNYTDSFGEKELVLFSENNGFLDFWLFPWSDNLFKGFTIITQKYNFLRDAYIKHTVVIKDQVDLLSARLAVVEGKKTEIEALNRRIEDLRRQLDASNSQILELKFRLWENFGATPGGEIPLFLDFI
jgi:hypothetical protein